MPVTRPMLYLVSQSKWISSLRLSGLYLLYAVSFFQGQIGTSYTYLQKHEHIRRNNQIGAAWHSTIDTGKDRKCVFWNSLEFTRTLTLDHIISGNIYYKTLIINMLELRCKYRQIVLEIAWKTLLCVQWLIVSIEGHLIYNALSNQCQIVWCTLELQFTVTHCRRIAW